jgi:DNA-binding beta-propeller fold protein YncE
MILGTGEYRYQLVDGWAKIPEYFVLDDAVDVATDSQDRVFVFCRGNHPILIFDRNGDFISCWGEGYFREPHGIFIGPDNAVYLTDSQSHTVEKFTPGGEMQMRLGTKDYAQMTARGEPFNMPTGIALSQSGDLFVSDGYANRRVHRFSPNGELLKSWGEYGNGPGQFNFPHNIDVDQYGTVYVCDRENERIQTFTSEGEFITEWTGLHKPGDLYIDRNKDLVYLAEQGRPGPKKSRISIRDLDGNILSMWEGRESDGDGVLENPHGIWADSHGDIYVGEIKRKRILKFARV